MDPKIADLLAITPASSAEARTVDITTIGARSGQARRIEIWFYRVDGDIYLTTTPAVRHWYANLLANPDFVLHVKNGATADLPATAEPVLDPAERLRIFEEVVADLNQPRHRGYLSQPVAPAEEWVTGSPLMRVRFR